jgi:O-antigen/teichoic acid export membrane protein
LINASFSVSLVVALLVAGIFLAGLGWWSPGLSVLQSTVLYALLFLISNVTFALMQIQEVLFVAERSSRLNFYKALFSNLLQVGLLFLCLFLPDWTTIFAVIVLSEALALVFFNWRYRRTVRRDYRPALVLDPQAWKPIAAYSLSNFVAERISLLPNSVIPLIVLNSLGAASSAYFYMAWSLAGTLGMAGQALGLSLFAESSHNPDEIEKNALHSFAAGMLILVPGVLGILVLGPLALNFLGKAYSQEGTPLLNLLALSVIPMALHRITASVLRARNKIKHLLLANTVTAVLRIGLSLWFIPYLALPGVGIASLASNVLAGVFVAMITFPDALRRGLYSLAGRRVVIFRPVKKDEK